MDTLTALTALMMFQLPSLTQGMLSPGVIVSKHCIMCHNTIVLQWLDVITLETRWNKLIGGTGGVGVV